MSGKLGWLLVGGALACVLVVLGVMRGCERQEDTPGQRADSVLATDTTWKRTVHEQDSLLLVKDSIIEATDRDRNRWKRVALASLRDSDSVQAEVDSAVALGVPDSVAPAVFWKDQYEAQRRVAARLRSETVPALLATIAADSLGMQQRDEYGAAMRSQRDFARDRARQVTAEFARYRQATKPGIDLGLFRVPDWADDVALVLGTATLTYVAVKD